MAVAVLPMVLLLFALAVGLSGLLGSGWLRRSSGSFALMVPAWSYRRCGHFGRWAGFGAGSGVFDLWGWSARLLGRSGNGGLRWVWAEVHSRRLTQSCDPAATP